MTAKKTKSLKFPRSFIWGTATSAHQIEGNNKNSDWWQAEENQEIKNFSGKACNSYEMWRDDHELIRKMNNNAYRVGIEWARIEPRMGKWDVEAMHHYIEVISDLKKHNIKVMLTLHHFTNPAWFAARGGWTNPLNIKYFKRYVKYVIQHLGGLVDFWITINEPGVYVDLSFLKGVWPPKLKDWKRAFLAYVNMAWAHRVVYKLIHNKLKDAKVGFAMNVMSFAAYKKHRLIELLYVHLADRFINHSFYDLTKGKHDFLGVNYYFRVRLKQKEGSLRPEVEEIKEQERELSDMGWMIYPHGIFDVLKDLADFKLPIYITENGIAARDDTKRVRFLIEHLREIHHAINAGVDVRGYFHWSLLDNFEWDKGFEQRFGLVAVDFKTFKRSLKPSGMLYGEIAGTNSLEDKVCDRYLHNSESVK